MTLGVRQRRYPTGPLRGLLGVSTTTELARTCGVVRRQMQRYGVYGLPESVADRIAVRLGMHPAEIWPEWFEEAS